MTIPLPVPAASVANRESARNSDGSFGEQHRGEDSTFEAPLTSAQVKAAIAGAPISTGPPLVRRVELDSDTSLGDDWQTEHTWQMPDGTYWTERDTYSVAGRIQPEWCYDAKVGDFVAVEDRGGVDWEGIVWEKGRDLTWDEFDELNTTQAAIQDNYCDENDQARLEDMPGVDFYVSLQSDYLHHSDPDDVDDTIIKSFTEDHPEHRQSGMPYESLEEAEKTARDAAGGYRNWDLVRPETFEDAYLRDQEDLAGRLRDLAGVGAATQ